SKLRLPATTARLQEHAALQSAHSALSEHHQHLLVYVNTRLEKVPAYSFFFSLRFVLVIIFRMTNVQVKEIYSPARWRCNPRTSLRKALCTQVVALFLFLLHVLLSYSSRHSFRCLVIRFDAAEGRDRRS